MSKDNGGRITNILDLICIIYGSLAVILGIIIIIISIWG